MPHIHTEPGQYDHTVSIYIFRTDFDEPKVMLHFHRKFSTYAQFGGHIELHENPWQTAIHELKEESGYDIEQLRILQPEGSTPRMTTAVVHPFPAIHATLTYPGQSGHFHTDTMYAFTADEAPRNMPDEGESTDIQLFTKQELISLSNDKIDNVTREAALYIFDNCLVTWRPLLPSDFKS